MKCRHKVYAISVIAFFLPPGFVRCKQCGLFRRRPRIQIFDRKPRKGTKP